MTRVVEMSKGNLIIMRKLENQDEIISYLYKQNNAFL